MKPFSALNISKAMLDNLADLKYETMTEIQEASIPVVLAGKDILAQAKTGSGKTAAFGVGLLENLDLKRYRVQALILCPTRELAEQVTAELRRLAKFQHNLKLVSLTGGIPAYKQEQSLKHQAHIAVGTPGRVLKLLGRETLNLDEVKTVVLDEGDRMLEMGFIDQVGDIFEYAPKEAQVLCFSATFPEEIKKLSRTIMNNPVEITVDSEHHSSVIKQQFFEVKPADKIKTAIAILKKHRPQSTLIFCNTKDQCRRVRAELNKVGFHSLELHGDLEQKERTETLIRFSNGSSRILVATDVAARGLDINDLSAVINIDLPFEPETYTHRIGRTARAGKEGLAFSIMSSGEQFRLDEINKNRSQTCSTESFDGSGIDNTIFQPEFITVSINGGRKQKISAGDILGGLTAEGGISGKEVGKIDRLDYLTFVAIKREVADKALAVLENKQVKGRSFLAKIND